MISIILFQNRRWIDSPNQPEKTKWYSKFVQWKIFIHWKPLSTLHNNICYKYHTKYFHKINKYFLLSKKIKWWVYERPHFLLGNEEEQEKWYLTKMTLVCDVMYLRYFPQSMEESNNLDIIINVWSPRMRSFLSSHLKSGTANTAFVSVNIKRRI